MEIKDAKSLLSRATVWLKNLLQLAFVNTKVITNVIGLIGFLLSVHVVGCKILLNFIVHVDQLNTTIHGAKKKTTLHLPVFGHPLRHRIIMKLRKYYKRK